MAVVMVVSEVQLTVLTALPIQAVAVAVAEILAIVRVMAVQAL